MGGYRVHGAGYQRSGGAARPADTLPDREAGHVVVSVARNPLPPALAHLSELRRAGEIAGLRQAALWVEDSRKTMQRDSVEYRWATGAGLFLRQLADERDGIAPWHSDMARAKCSRRPVMVGRRGSKLMAMAIWHGQAWRHADSLVELCFEPDVWQPLPRAAP